MAEIESNGTTKEASETPLEEQKKTEETLTGETNTTETESSTDLSASIGTPSKESITDAKPVVVTEILDKEAASTTDSAASTIELDIIKQIEYYFSDSNMARDKFLTEETQKDAGWVPLTVLLTFKRLLALSDDANVIVDAMIKSKDDLVQISKDRLKLRRNPGRPLPEQNEETRKETIGRTAYVKGFPADTDMSALLKYFDQYEKVSNVIMRRYMDKPTKEYKFKGSVFVVFETKEYCAKFLVIDKLEYEEKELEKKWQSDYYESKKAERQTDKRKQKKVEEEKITLPKGAVFHLEGLGSTTTRESIKDAVALLGGEVAFIDYTKGDKAGHVRLTTADSAKPLVDKLTNSKLKVDGVESVARVLEGEEETEFLIKVVENMKTRRNQGNRFKGGRNNRYQSGRKRKAHDDDGPPSKK